MAKKLTNFFVLNDLIQDEDQALYYYGLRQGFLVIANIITTIIIGFLFKMIWQTGLFFCAYIALRMYGGGYHARTEFRCYLLSMALTILVSIGIRFIPLTSFVIFGLIVLGGALIWYLAPVEDANKTLDEIEIKTYKNRTRIILTIEIVVALLAVLLNVREIALVISISVITLAFMLTLGRVKISTEGNLLEEQKNKQNNEENFNG